MLNFVGQQLVGVAFCRSTIGRVELCELCRPTIVFVGVKLCHTGTARLIFRAWN